MGARQKLNSGYVGGSVVLAGLVGWLFQSWLMFFVAVIAFIALHLYAGDIRPTGRQS